MGGKATAGKAAQGKAGASSGGGAGGGKTLPGGKTLTRADLAEAVVRKVGLPRNESQDLVELVLGEISASLARGDSVKLSSFGSFGIRQKGERMGRNPKTGEEVPITPRRVLVFRPSNIMKERINQGLVRRRAAE
jgi:integration host factor subunit alpha